MNNKARSKALIAILPALCLCIGLLGLAAFLASAGGPPGTPPAIFEALPVKFIYASPIPGTPQNDPGAIPGTPGTPARSPVSVVLPVALNVRSGPGINNPPIAWLEEGDRVIIDHCVNNWGFLALYNGYLNTSYLDPDPCSGGGDK